MDSNNNKPAILNPLHMLNFKQALSQLDISESTRRDYGYRIKHFEKFINNFGFNNNSYLEYKRFLNNRVDLKISSKNKYLISARVILNEWHRLGYIPDITKNVKQFRQSISHKITGFNLKDINRINEAITNLPESLKKFRLKILFTLMVYQGLRQSEILNLQIDDLNMNEGYVFIKGKGCDDKEMVNLHSKSIEAIDEYIQKVKIKTGYVFQSFSNRKSNLRLSLMTLNRDFNKLFHSIGIKKNIHGFRHFYITTLLNNLDVRTVRKFSRHKNLEMLVVYDDEIDVKNKTSQVFNCFNNIN